MINREGPGKLSGPFAFERVQVLKPIELTTLLSIDECVNRIDAAIDGNFTIFGSKAAIGSTSAAGFKIRKRIWYRNSFQTILRAELVSEGAATRIRCSFGMAWLVLAFMAVWFGMAGIFVVTALWGSLATSTPSPAGFVIFLMPALGAVIVIVGRWFARNEAQYLVDFVCRTLDAQKTSPVTAPQSSTIVRSRG